MWRAPLTTTARAEHLELDFNQGDCLPSFRVFVGDPFVRRNSGGHVLEAKIVVDDVVDGWPPSDHAGVFAEIVWPE